MPRLPSPKRIAQICSSRSWGGLEMYVSTLCVWQMQAGLTVELFCVPGSPLSIEAQKGGLSQHAFAPAGYLDGLASWRLNRDLNALDIDLIHAHYSRDLWNIAPAIRFGTRRPLIFSKHIGTQKPKRDPIHRWIYGSVDRVIAISQVIKDNILATHPVEPERVLILHHGIESTDIQAGALQRERIRAQWGIGDDEILIGTIGRLQAGKGHLEFLEMAGHVAARFPQTRFVIVGEPTRDEEVRAEPIYRKAETLQLKERLFFAGFRADIPAVLAAMDIFAFPSRAEAFGLVLIEAMAAGKAVVATRCDGVLDIIQDGRDGLMFAPMDVEDLIHRIVTLIEDSRLRYRLGMAAQQRVQDKFTRARMLDDLNAIYADAQTAVRLYSAKRRNLFII